MKINDVIRKELIEDWSRLNNSIEYDCVMRKDLKALYKRTWLYFSAMARKGSIVFEDVCLINELRHFCFRIIGEEVIHIADEYDLWGDYYTYEYIVYQLLDNITKKRFTEGILELVFYEKKYYLYTDGLDDVFDEFFDLKEALRW